MPITAIPSTHETPAVTSKEVPPPPKGYLESLAAAYCATLSSLMRGAEAQMANFDELRVLDEQMSKAVLMAADEEIERRTAFAQMVASIEEKQAEVSTWESISTYVLIAGAIATVLSLGAAAYGLIGSAGTAAAAEADTVALLEAGGTAETLGTDLTTFSARGVEEAATAETLQAEGAALEAQTAGIDWKRIVTTFCISAGINIPQTYGGVLQGKLGDYMEEVKKYQITVGESSAKVKLYECDFAFYQQSLTRTGSTMETLSDQIGNTLTAATHTIETYKQMVVGALDKLHN